MPPEASQARSHKGWTQLLDHVPMRNTTSSGSAHASDEPDGPSTTSRTPHLSQRVLYPRLPGPPSSPSPPDDPQSYSPTSSEVDALEASFFDYEIQSSNLDGHDIASVAAQKASSANYIRDDDDCESTTSSSYLSLPDTADDTLVDRPKSLKEWLYFAWPQCPSGLENAPFIVLWELTRVAVHCNVDPSRIHLTFDESWKDQDVFWSSLKNLRGFKGRKFPAKSDPRAWRAGIDDIFRDSKQAVIFTATLHAADPPSGSGPPMRLELEPLQCEQSSRLFRRFGSDRFLELRIPSLESWPMHAEDNLETVAQKLASSRHAFLNRRWAAFYVRERPMRAQLGDDPSGKEAKVIFYDRVLFFAEAGTNLSLSPSFAPVVSRIEMLDWLLALKDQGSQPYLKLFHRISLGLTQTFPAVVLDKHQIRDRSQDIYSETTGEAMNDGAGLISPSLMRKVRDILGLQTIPSAIQGRLGSAKGMWLVDAKDHSNEDWIETYPLQRKWQCNMSDEAHRTLEVRSWSTELSSARLNKQFLPILEDRAKDPTQMRATFARNMTIESEAELEDLKAALQHSELFRKWIREGSQPSFQRLASRAIPFLGGLPDSFEDTMSFLVDGGFEPMQLKFLQDMVFLTQKTKGKTMKEDLKIKIAKSTYAYMLVDFWGVLEPDEVHLCFSSQFNDGAEDLSDLDARDILVARSPAHLPSDIQKVKAVFKPELRHLRDVIIFSSKGDTPLAAKLSGGDYDGDKAWVCWDPDIVNNFRNHSLPPKPDFSRYLTKVSEKLGDLRLCHGDEHYVDVMLMQAFCFNLRQKYLGSCTLYKENFAYHQGLVSDKATMKLSWLLSELADEPKQGILFTKQNWNRFRDEVAGKKGLVLPMPAYKTGGNALRPNAGHIIDYLMYTAKQVVDKFLKDLHEFHEASKASHTDADVVGYWEQFERTFGDHSKYGRPRCAWFVHLRDGLKSDVDACVAEWNDTMRPGTENYPDKVRQVYPRWCAIQPQLPADAVVPNVVSETVRKLLLEEDLVAPDLSKWELLKASLAFKYYHRGHFVWRMAGRQLQAIKALAVRSRGVTRAAAPVVVVPHMYVALRPDNSYIKRLMVLEGDENVAPESIDGGEESGGLEGLPSSSQETDC